MRMCPPPRLLITSGVMWRDMTSYDWLNKFYSCYMATVVVIVNGRGLGIGSLAWPDRYFRAGALSLSV